MKTTTVAGGAVAAVLVLLALGLVGRRVVEPDVAPAGAAAPAVSPSTPSTEEAVHPGSIYGRITTVDGATYEGRLRWGGGQEAFWGDYFNGDKKENPWVVHAPADRMREKRTPIEILGFEIPRGERQKDLGRLFMARFGDIARVEARGRDVRVTLKSGTVFDLDRFGASDFDDGVRVWDGRRGAVDLDSLRIRAIELLPAPRPGAASDRLHGTVRTRQGDFTGFVQWNREKGVGSDELYGRTAEGGLGVRLDTVRSIERRSRDSARVTLHDGRAIVLSDTPEVAEGNRGVYVDDRRYGRVLISWNAFERLDFNPGGAGPAYGDYPAGRPLTGSVTGRDGRRLAGRLVYDLDESETTETLDAPAEGVDYTIPFGLIASIVPAAGKGDGAPGAQVTLRSGEALPLERRGDLGDGNAGVLVFVEGRARAEYVPWTNVARVDLDRPPAMYPPLSAP